MAENNRGLSEGPIDEQVIFHKHTGADAPQIDYTDLVNKPRERLLMAREIYPATTSGCSALAQTEWPTNDIDFQALNFDKNTVEYAQTSFLVPDGIVAGKLSTQIYWNAIELLQNTHSVVLDLDSSQHLSIADGSQTGLDASDDFTIECWINLTQLASTAGGDMTIVSKRSTSGDIDGLRFFIESSNNKLTVECYENTLATTKEMDEAFDSGDLGNWIHVAVTVSLNGATGTSDINFYKNGSSKASTFINDNIDQMDSVTGADFRIGASTTGANTPESYLDAKVDEVRFWDDIRTSQEISDNYNIELTGSEANLQGYWQFDGSVLTDLTSNSNDLTNNNSATFSTDVPFSGGVGSEDAVLWSIEAISYENESDVDVSWGTAVEKLDNNTQTQGGFNITDEIIVTPNGTVNGGNLIQIRIGRQADDASDDFNFEAQLLALKVKFI